MERAHHFVRPHPRSAFQPPSRNNQQDSMSMYGSLDFTNLDAHPPGINYHISPNTVTTSQPFSQPFLPFGNTFSSLMHSALFESPPNSASAPMPTPMTPTLSAATSLQASTANSQSPSASTMAQSGALGRGTSSRDMRPTSREINQAQPATTGPSRKRKSSDIWSPNDTVVLLDLYEDKWISLNRGNFKAKHWTELARDLCSRCSVVFTDNQCKNKWENMKKTFMKEKQKESSSGAEPSRWEYYARMEDLLGGTPKVSGLNDGFTGEEFVNPEVVSLVEDYEAGQGEDDGEGTPPGVDVAGGHANAFATDSTPATGSVDTNDEDGVPGPSVGSAVRGQRVRKRKTAAALEGLGTSFERGVGTLAKSFERVELRRLDLEEKRLETQLQIARILAGRGEAPERDHAM